VKKVLANSKDVVLDPGRSHMAMVVKNVKIQMKGVWNDAQNYGVSNEVFMVEVEVIHRLLADGVMPCMSMLYGLITD
jgi:hypothetical protein